MSKIIFAVLAVICLLLGVSVVFRSLGPGPQVAFDALLAYPERVSEVDGFVSKGDAYDVHLRFMADPSWVGAASNMGFSKLDCDDVEEQIHFSVTRLAAWPPWQPHSEDAACFKRFGENAWSPNARDYLLVEPEGGWVYFSGTGREHDRAMPGFGQ